MPRQRPRTIVANSLEELENLNRLMAAGEPDFPPTPAPAIPPEEPDDTPDDDEDSDTEIPAEDEDPPQDDDDPDEDEEAASTPAASAYSRSLHVQKSWRYPGHIPLRRPSFIDPSWIAYLSYDEATRTPAGPALRVPTPSGDKYARPGDYVVMQTSGGSPAYVDVWPKDEFERFFGRSRAA